MSIDFDFLEGFDYCDFADVDFKYTTGDFTTFAQLDILPGRATSPASGGGRSFYIFNTAFGVYSKAKILTPRNVWYWGFDYKPTGGNGMGTSIFQRWESGASLSVLGLDPNSNTQLAIRQTAIDSTSCQWDLFTGGQGTNGSPGTLILTLPQVFAKDAWYFVEMAVQFGPHGAITMWVNDVEVFSQTNLNVGTANPDRFTRRWQSFGPEGYVLDNLYIAHGSRPGPLRISAHFPTSDALPHLWTPSSASQHYLLVHEGTPGYGTVLSAAPDQDTTYVAAADAGILDYYQFGSDPCYGQILAIAANACARKVSGNPTLDLLCRTPDGTVNTLGNFSLPNGTPLSPSPATPSYYTGQAISEISLVNGAIWTDRDLQNCAWGFESQGVGPQRVTQLFLEKVVTLSGAPYDCGAQSYAY